MCPLAFSQELAASLRDSGVEFKLGIEVEACTQEPANPGVCLSLSDDTELQFDAVVLAAGVASGQLLKRLAPAAPILPLYGARGHSLTLDVSHLDHVEGHVLRRPVEDGDALCVLSPLPQGHGRQFLRITGFADFDGWVYGPAGVQSWRVAQLISTAEQTFGEKLLDNAGSRAALSCNPSCSSAFEPATLVPDADALTRWTGLRPMSPDGLPVVGLVPGVGPVFVNAGHGALGWSLSAATAELLADSVAAELGMSTARAPTSNEEPWLTSLFAMRPQLCPGRFAWGHLLQHAWDTRMAGGGES